ncbi:glycosyltransferase family 2 protein [Sulfurimonas hydrogeniphila]|uniref:glycosyltransferase family 2 protein n=1 Tax=Sulfurimonas hydrogeniphila TaxID=2509341 RepID=UPI00125EF19D|nr:glycosyltransferase [Sulfurimonas hydrogeniphila]
MDISVIIPTYNRYKLLKRAIKSVLAQTYTPKEIIVIDDGSTDTTCNIQNDFPNIIYIYQKNSGVSAARNKGIEIAKSEWIAFLDSDDEFCPQKLQKQVDFHTHNLDILMSYTHEKWVRNGITVKIPKKYRKIGKDAFLENLSYCNIAPSSVILHKSLLETVGLFDEHLAVCEDYDLWLRITCKHKIGLIDETLIIKYAGHDAQLGFRKNMDVYRIKVLKKLLLTCNSEEKRLLIQYELDGKILEQQKRQRHKILHHS